MVFHIFFRGLIIGFAVAAAIGPIAILCIHRSLNKGYLSGLVSGIGAASGDAIYGIIAAFGLTFVSSFLIREQIFLKFFGMFFLFYAGVKTFNAKQCKDKNIISRSLPKDYFSTFILTLVNPMTLIAFISIFVGFDLIPKTGDYLSSTLLVLGFFFGSVILYSGLGIFVQLFRKRITDKTLIWANKISGLIIMSFALTIFFSMTKHFLFWYFHHF